MGSPSERGISWFTGVYEQHYAAVFRYGLRRLADTNKAEELAQEVFVVTWQRRSDTPENCLPWLYGVARRLLANHWRTKRNAPSLVDLPAEDRLVGPHDDPAAVVLTTDIHAALAELSPNDQEILRLIGWEELGVADAARVLGCSRSAAGVRLHRARRRLSRVLRHSAPSPEPVQHWSCSTSA